MDKMIFKVPTLDDEEAILNYKKNWLENKPNEMMNGACGIERYENLSEWFHKIEWYASADQDELAKFQKVPQLTYLAIVNDKIVGMVGIRPILNDWLRESGIGHVGYGVAPEERKKGYGTEILKQALQILKSYQIDYAIVGCYYDNIGSSKVIVNNGGILDRDWIDSDGLRSLRYHIKL